MTVFQRNAAFNYGAERRDVPSAFTISGSVNRSTLPTRIALASWLDRQSDARVHVIGRIVIGNLRMLERTPDHPGLLAMTAANGARLQQAINGS